MQISTNFILCLRYFHSHILTILLCDMISFSFFQSFTQWHLLSCKPVRHGSIVLSADHHHSRRWTSTSYPFKTFISRLRQWARFLSSLSSLANVSLFDGFHPMKITLSRDVDRAYTSSVFVRRFLFWESLNPSTEFK